VTKLAAAGSLDRDALVVAVLTGNGLKDPDTAERTVAGRIIESEASEAGVLKALGW
jgi:threonine synthase